MRVRLGIEARLEREWERRERRWIVEVEPREGRAREEESVSGEKTRRREGEGY